MISQILICDIIKYFCDVANYIHIGILDEIGFCDIKNLISRYQKLWMNSWYRKLDICDIKIVFIISHNDILISHIQILDYFFGIKNLTYDITKLNLRYHNSCLCF